MRRSGNSPTVLAGDVGGTHTRLGLFAQSRRRPRMIASRTFPSRDYDGLEAIITAFLEDRSVVISAACFGVAGPVLRGAVKATNLPWSMSVRSLAGVLGTPKVLLINDLMANAEGIGALGADDFVTIQRGDARTGNAALLSAGTGLGAAVLFWDGQRHVASPSEGGHANFGPRDRFELELLSFLLRRFGHVSYERILSGPGLVNIYEFLKQTRRFGPVPGWLTAALATGDPGEAIVNAALGGTSRLCAKALDLFASVYGAAAGNLALQVMATAGVYLGGGIAPRIVDKLRDGTFLDAFRSKGRLSPVVRRIPVMVIMNDRAALLGAAAGAFGLVRAAGKEGC